MKTDLSLVLPLLPSDKVRDNLVACVEELERAEARGVIKNKLFVDAKDTISRRIENIVDAYNAKHGYHFDPIVSGAHQVPFALKAAVKCGDKGRVELFTALLPVAELVKAVKPMAVKKQDQGLTDRQRAIAAERAGHEMTCQCCSRGIFANTGMLAHHGYERPGDGWQTASCWGARRLPWEADRAVVAELIAHLTAVLVASEDSRRAVAAETMPVTHHYSVYIRTALTRAGRNESRKLLLTRDTFAAAVKENVDGVFTHKYDATFDKFKAADLASRDRKIEQLRRDIKEYRHRYASWKQTHKWNGSTWEAI